MRGTFDNWLRAQQGRADPVGDLARDIAADEEWVEWSGDDALRPLSLATYLYERTVDANVEKAYARAVAEWWAS